MGSAHTRPTFNRVFPVQSRDFVFGAPSRVTGARELTSQQEPGTLPAHPLFKRRPRVPGWPPWHQIPRARHFAFIISH
jgi:hypothetical protein